MSELWRCDVCLNLIDPVEGEERTVLTVELEPHDGESETDSLDLCQECRPPSLSAHMDWLMFQMEEDNA